MHGHASDIKGEAVPCGPLLYALIKSLRQATTWPMIYYKPRVEPASPVHAKRVEGCNDVYQLRGQYVAFVFLDDVFKQSPLFTLPESAQHWANQTRQQSDI